jgi:hypothetical protein
MRMSKVCRQLTGVESLYASDLTLSATGLVFTVCPRWRKPRCGGCGRCAGRYDRARQRYWRDMAVGATVLWLAYAPWRVSCPPMWRNGRASAVGRPCEALHHGRGGVGSLSGADDGLHGDHASCGDQLTRGQWHRRAACDAAP